MDSISIYRIEVKEKALGCDRDNLLTVKELLGREIGVTDDLYLRITSPLSLEDVEYYLKNIEMFKFNKYKGLYFLLNGIPYQVSPHLIHLGKIKLMLYETT